MTTKTNISLIVSIVVGMLPLQTSSQEGPTPAPTATQSQATIEAAHSDESTAVTSHKENTRPGKRSSSIRSGRTVAVNPEVRTFNFTSDSFGSEAFNNGLPGSRAYRPVMIRSSRADPKLMEELSEDIAIMSRLLDKAVADQTDVIHPPKAAGINIFALASGLQSSGRAMYVDDYGVIFTLVVNIPLKAEPKTEEVNPKEPTRKGAWEEARSELYGPKRRSKRWQPNAWRQFDQGEVDALKSSLIDTLRHATNIRHLKANDLITVVVRGTPESDERQAAVHMDSKTNADNVVIEDTASAESTMVLRVQKIDLDRAAGGKDSGELRKAVRISVY